MNFLQVVQDEFGGMPQLAPLDFDLDLAGFRLTGRLDRIWPDRMIRYRCTKLKAKDRLRAWIEHLVLNTVRQGNYPRKTLLIMTDGANIFAPVEDAADYPADSPRHVLAGFDGPSAVFSRFGHGVCR